MLILSRKYGRLCNRLFNASHILALAIERGQTFVNLSFYDYAQYFPSTQNDMLCRYPVRTGLIRRSEFASRILYYLAYNFAYSLHYLSRLGVSTTWLRLWIVRPARNRHHHLTNDVDLAALPIDFSKPQAIFLQGYNLRSLELVKKHGDKIREHFRPDNAYRSAVSAFIDEHRKDHDLLVGVVIRHGDYKKYQGGKYFYPLQSYLNWINQLQGLFPGKRIKFLIFSDEEQDTSSFQAAGIDFFFRSGHMMENLFSLAECDYIVTAPSTYGLWASFYGKVPLAFLDEQDQVLSSIDAFSICEG
jgi:hypothetical protein